MIDFEGIREQCDPDPLQERRYNKGRWITPHLGKTLYNLVVNSNAKVAIESGTANGYSGLCIASALPEDGILYTFDPVERAKIWNDPNVDLEEIKETYGKIFYCKSAFHRGIKKISLPTTPIFYYIDGNHKQSMVEEEIATIAPLLRPGDMIVFDDYNASGYAAVARVNKAIESSGLLEAYESYTENRFLVVKV